MSYVGCSEYLKNNIKIAVSRPKFDVDSKNT